ncbi:unnamed protein product [Notodromas monacha]|uniref:Uncharacterized protein n=1 Tax=Notodromas monacha TaxID=399045 RepID=A0A7R9C167_9CRUS|nr:unnamed protein product [Notodromas monacha]CAG0923911.1 unnamed protein product [Notodromas monacha]
MRQDVVLASCLLSVVLPFGLKPVEAAVPSLHYYHVNSEEQPKFYKRFQRRILPVHFPDYTEDDDNKSWHLDNLEIENLDQPKPFVDDCPLIEKYQPYYPSENESDDDRFQRYARSRNSVKQQQQQAKKKKKKTKTRFNSEVLACRTFLDPWTGLKCPSRQPMIPAVAASAAMAPIAGFWPPHYFARDAGLAAGHNPWAAYSMMHPPPVMPSYAQPRASFLDWFITPTTRIVELVGRRLSPRPPMPYVPIRSKKPTTLIPSQNNATSINSSSDATSDPSKPSTKASVNSATTNKSTSTSGVSSSSTAAATTTTTTTTSTTVARTVATLPPLFGSPHASSEEMASMEFMGPYGIPYQVSNPFYSSMNSDGDFIRKRTPRIRRMPEADGELGGYGSN